MGYRLLSSVLHCWHDCFKRVTLAPYFQLATEMTYCRSGIRLLSVFPVAVQQL